MKQIYRVNAQTLDNDVTELHTTLCTALFSIDHILDVIEAQGVTGYDLKGTVTLMTAHNGVFYDTDVVYEREIKG